MKTGWMFGFAPLAAGCTEARQGGQSVSPKIMVYLGGVTVPEAPNVRNATAVASRILASVGVDSRWEMGTPDPQRNPCRPAICEAIEIQIDSITPPEDHPGALGYADLSRLSGARIHAFYDRIYAVHDARHTYQVLGHVLAHEISHILDRKSV